MSDADSISLDELAQAFAQVIGTSPKAPVTSDLQPSQPAAEAASDPAAPTAGVVDEADSGEPSEDAGPVTPLGILEAMLFVGDRGNSPLTAAKAAELMRGVEPTEIAGLVRELNRRYAQNECPYYVVEESDGYRLMLRKQFSALRERFFGRMRDARLSQAAVDVLSIVAYQQPVTADQIGEVRGKVGGHVLSQLVNRGLLRIEREGARESGRGKRPVTHYYTTDRFLKLFGLATLADLPQSEELDKQ